MSDPQHDTLPSALSSLFDSPHHHFLPAPGDDNDILIDPQLVAAAAASASAAGAAGTVDSSVHPSHSGHQTPVTDAGDVDAVAAAATVLELAADGDPTKRLDAGGSQQHTPHPHHRPHQLAQQHEHAQQHQHQHAHHLDTPSKPRHLGTRRADPSPLDVTLLAMVAENERLRKMIGALERPSLTTTAAAAASAAQDAEDAIAEATLRELATAAVGGGAMGFGFESLQHQLEQHAQHLESLGEAAAAAAAANASNNEVSAADFLSGLVTQVTAGDAIPSTSGSTAGVTATAEGSSETTETEKTDPFKITHLALEADIARTRDAIAAKEAEIAAVRAGGLPVPEPEDQSALEAQLAKTNTLVETVQRNLGVLRGIAARLQESHDDIQAEVEEKLEELGALDDDAGAVAADGARALVEVRGYIEGALKLWRERGQLPPAPLPHLPVIVRSETLVPPPSSLPKKRGRPARSTQKNTVVPAALAHLVPDPQTVKAREMETPIRRKGIKRGKVELEREKQREEEEGEMLRNLVGMGVWSREPGFEGDV